MNKHHIIFSDLPQLITEIKSSQSVLISEKNIFHLYPKIFNNRLPQLILNINENKKNLHTAEKIWDFLMKNNITKSHTIFIIGGGVLNDVAMFACSVFKRGIPTVAVPTTLLSMVDASVGGKNAINYRHIKNIIGNICLPQKNIIIPEFLQTLPTQELLSGWAEIIKIALVTDASFYHSITKQLHQSFIPTPSIIKKSIQLKLKIIHRDLYDQNIRQLLNFGHTIAHAIEGICDEQKKYIPHGIAVAQGMMIEAFLSYHLHLLSKEQFLQIFSHLQTHYPIPKINKHNIPLIIEKISQDKKNTSEHIHFSLIESIGKGKIKIPVDQQTIQAALHLFGKHYNT